MKKKSFEKPELSVEDLSHALYESNQKLTNTIQERNEIFANISHDLRSPITAIRSSIEYLQSLENPSKEELDSSLSLIAERSLVLEKMINDIFILTKMDFSSYALTLEEVPIIPFLEDIFFYYDQENKFADRNLILSVDDSFSASVLIDIDNFKRVIDNLFNNALKYSSKGDSITLSAKPDDDLSHVLISVADTGIGISPENQALVFNRSYRVSDARTPNAKQGAGLGLAICKSIIEKHNGKIWCYSEGLGKGSIFTIKLPLDNTGR